jgi:hypothetical protein
VNDLREAFADKRLLRKPHIAPAQKVLITNLDVIRRWMPSIFPGSVDQVDASDSPKTISPVPLLRAA